MAHVVFNVEGEITGIFGRPQPQLEGYQEIDDSDPRIAEFEAAAIALFNQQQNQPETKEQLLAQLRALTAKIEAL